MTGHQHGASGIMAAAGEGGAGDPAFTGDPYNVTDITLPPTDAGARILLQGDGDIQALRDQGADPVIGTWDNGQGGILDITDFDFRLDTISGSLGYSGGEAADTWISGAANIYWGVQETGVGITSFTGTFRIRPAGGGSDFDTASVSLTAEATP